MLLSVAALVPAPAPAAADSGSEFIAVANGYRADAGLAPVGFNAVIDDIAVERGKVLAADRALGHDLDYVIDRLESAGICWSGVGEIVAYNSTGTPASFGDQWFHSDGHRAIMLGDFTHAGGSRAKAGSTWYGVMVFVKVCGTSTPPTFSDIAGSPFRAEIEWLVGEKIASGCAPALYCPIPTVTREQMASFLARAMNLPPASADHFADDGASVHQENINRLTEAGITLGCGGDRFCPSGYVSRGEMASFLARALALPPTSTDFFNDDNGSMHEDSINRLAAAGIVTGCGGGGYCPGWGVSREQMAAYIERAFN